MEIESKSRQSFHHHLPQEIIEEVVSRLPVKSLLRFRCISRSWHSLIGSKRFIKTHLQNSTKNIAHHRVLMHRYRDKAELSQCCMLSSLLDKPDIHPLQVKFPTNNPPCFISVVGCCNGLFCISLDIEQIILWNPSTGISKKVPDSDMLIYRRGCYGFGWDESSGDYKVVVASREGQETRCDIYSLKSDSWKKKTSACSLLPYTDKRGTFASGRLHWECLVGFDLKWGIVGFDLEREVLDIVATPPSPSPSPSSSYSSQSRYQPPVLGLVGEWLAVQFWCESERRNHVWVMKEYGVKESWEKVMVIDHLCCPIWTSPTLDAFLVGGILLIKVGNLMVYDVEGLRSQVSSCELEYFESLISPLEIERERKRENSLIERERERKRENSVTRQGSEERERDKPHYAGVHSVMDYD